MLERLRKMHLNPSFKLSEIFSIEGETLYSALYSATFLAKKSKNLIGRCRLSRKIEYLDWYPDLSQYSMSILSRGSRPALCMRENRHTIFWLITTDWALPARAKRAGKGGKPPQTEKIVVEKWCYLRMLYF